MFKQLSENLDQLMRDMRLSADELARRTGLPASTIKKIRNNDNPNPTLTTLLPLAQFFSLTVSQFIGDEPLPHARQKGLHQPILSTLTSIPILSWQEAITWPTIHQAIRSTVTTEYQYSQDAFALVVLSEDWENLAKGTVLIIDPTIPVSHGDYVVTYKVGETLPMVHQALYQQEKLLLKTLIEEPFIASFTNDYTLLGVIVEYKKHLKLATELVEMKVDAEKS